jgi:peptidoglycan/LPS O-acetylase OafA/YrhL
LKTRPHPYKVFYVRRILRIFPPYYAVISLISLIAWLQHDSLNWRTLASQLLFLQGFKNESIVFKHILSALKSAHIPNLFAAQPLPPGLDFGFSVGPFRNSSALTWSLSIEEWFYILWAPLVLRLPRRALGPICLAVCAAALLVRWFGFLGFYTYFDFFSRIDMLLYGALLALWMERRKTLSSPAQRRGDRILLVGSGICGALLLSILFAIRPVLGCEIRDSITFSVFGLPLLGICLSGLLSYVIRNAGSEKFLNLILRLRPLVVVGTVSYTLYLVHLPAYFLAHQAADLMGIDTIPFGTALAISVISGALSLGVAQLSFKFFETPILKYKDAVTNRIMRQ